MVQHFMGCLLDGFGFVHRNQFAVHCLAHVFQHASVVAPSAAGEVLPQGGGGGRVERADVVGRIGDCGREHGQSPVCRFLYQGTLFFGDADAHGVDENHVAASQFVQSVGADFSQPDEWVVVGFRDFPQVDGLIVDEAYLRDAEPAVPYR